MIRRKILYIFCITAVTAVMFSGCSKDEKSKKISEDASAIWNDITKETPYQKWSFFPGHNDFQEGKAPHGPLHKIFVNEIAMNAKKVPMGDGAVIVKENYNKEKMLKAITVMKKIKGFNPSAGDWYWVKYTSDGKPGPMGKANGCIGCHESVRDNDWIFVHKLK